MCIYIYVYTIAALKDVPIEEYLLAAYQNEWTFRSADNFYLSSVYVYAYANMDSC
jgi:hypothetical protein